MAQLSLKDKPLSFFIEYPNQLRDVAVTEIVDLSTKYPYNEHLHLLHLIHDFQTHGAINEYLLGKAAMYATDRARLGVILANLSQQSNALSGSREEEAQKAIIQKAPAAAPIGTKRKTKKSAKKSPGVLKTWIVDPSELGAQKKSKRKRSRLEKVMERDIPKVGKDEFLEWLQRMDQLEATQVKANTDQSSNLPAKKKKKKKNKAATPETPDLPVSEALAELLAVQGRRKKAIGMYKLLSLKYPEKSAFFARKISDLEAKN